MNAPAASTPMDRKNVEAIYPLTPMQQGLLFHTLGAHGSDPGFLQLRCTLQGDLDLPIFRRAWEGVMERHAALRASVHWQEVKRPLQVAFRRVDLSWTAQDWSGLSLSAQQERVEGFLRTDRDRGLQLSRAPVMRLALFRTAEQEWELVWSCHHVLLDGWSGALVLAEVAALYQALREGTEAELPPARSYRDYVTWLQQQDSEQAEAFWRQALSGMTAPTPLPFAGVGRAERLSAAGYVEDSVALSAEATAALQSFARQRRLTLGTLAQGAWAVLLSAHSREVEVCFGATVAGRSAPLPGIEAMVGLFINALPVRVPVAREVGVVRFLERLQDQLGALRRFEHTSPVQIQGWSEVPGNRRLFDSLVVFENFPAEALTSEQAPHLRVGNLRGGITSSYPLTLVVVPGETLVLHLVYHAGRLAHGDARRLLEELRALLESLAAHPTARLAELMPTGNGARLVTAGAEGVRQAQPLSRPDYLGPADALELQLVQLWASVLQVHPVGMHDDFFELGGHSLTAAQLFDQVERTLGQRLPLATLFEAPTVAQLARRLRDAGWSPPWSSLVAMQPAGSRPPLFCVHSYEGNVLVYRDLARHLAPDQPVFGLQAIGLDGDQEPLTRVEEMAAHYLREVRSLRPRGPYFFAGICFGIAVILEMAHQLRAEGEEAELIALDSAFWGMPDPPKTAIHGILRRIHDRGRDLRQGVGRAVAHLTQSPQERRERLVAEAHQRAWLDYRPRPYPGRITLIRSTDYGAKQDWHLEIWSPLAAGGVQCYVVPGGHVTLLYEPHVRHLAAQLRACMDAAPPGA